MASAARPFVTLKPLKSDNHICPFKPSFIRPSIVHYNPIRPQYHFPYGSLFKTQNKPLVPPLRSSSNRYGSEDDDDDDPPPRISYREYKTQLMTWSVKQSLPVAIAGYTFSYALESFLFGFCVQSSFAWLVPFQDMSIEELLSDTGDYFPFFLSFAKSPWLCGRNYAVFIAIYIGITYGIGRLSGKKPFLIERLRGDNSFVQREMVGAFVAGVVQSLVIGFWYPIRILSVAVFYALLFGFIAIFLKLITGRPNPARVAIDENAKGTKSYFYIVFMYWMSKFYYLVTGLSSFLYYHRFGRYGRFGRFGRRF